MNIQFTTILHYRLARIYSKLNTRIYSQINIGKRLEEYDFYDNGQ